MQVRRDEILALDLQTRLFMGDESAPSMAMARRDDSGRADPDPIGPRVPPIGPRVSQEVTTVVTVAASGEGEMGGERGAPGGGGAAVSAGAGGALGGGDGRLGGGGTGRRHGGVRGTSGWEVEDMSYERLLELDQGVERVGMHKTQVLC